MDDAVLKIDFVNDVLYRSGDPIPTKLFYKTDTITNILSNKLSALSRLSEKDVADIVFIARKFDFNWVEIMKEASEKNLWINPVEAAKILDRFPVEKRKEINWVTPLKDLNSFEKQLQILIGDLLSGCRNSLFNRTKYNQ